MNQSLRSLRALPDIAPGSVLDLTTDTSTMNATEQECQEAFDNRCWEKGLFKNCCATLERGMMKSAYTCSWEFEVDDKNMKQEKIHGVLYSRPGEQLKDWKHCDDACQELKSPKERYDFCSSETRSCEQSPMIKRLSNCTRAINSFLDACRKPPAWCSETGYLSTGSFRSDIVLSVAVAALALVVVVVTVVKCRTWSLTSEERCHSFMG